MKTRNITRLVMICVLVLMIVVIPVHAYENYDTKPVFGDEYAALKKKVSDFSLVDGPEQDRMIKCFAISKNGLIALAFDGEYAQIDVYNSDGTFLYGYSFLNKGNAFSVFFEGERLSIYHAKGGYVASFDAKGNCTLIHEVLHTKATSEAYHNDFYRPSSGQVGDLFYTAENTMSLTRYGRFMVEDEQGNEIIIYELSKEAILENAIFACFFGGITVCVLFIAHKNRRSKIEEGIEQKNE